MNNSRMVQFELLRILAMCGVVMNHVFNYGLHIYGDFCIDTSSTMGFLVWTILELMKLVCLPSVNCYILITGYFLINRSTLRLKGAWKVWSTTWIYAVGIYLLSVAFGAIPFEWNELQRHATPLLSNSYWFVTSYIVLLLFAPSLSWGLQRMSKRQYQVALAVGGIVCFQPLLGQFTMDYLQILLFVYLFMIGGYIRRFTEKTSLKKYSIIAYTGILMVMFAYTLYKNKPLNNSSFTIYAMTYHGLVLPLSVALFMIVKEWRIRKTMVRKCILTVAPLSFAVYIIHTQSVVDSWLWTVSAEWLSNCHTSLLPIACTAITISVFLVCILAEYIRVLIVRGALKLKTSLTSRTSIRRRYSSDNDETRQKKQMTS